MSESDGTVTFETEKVYASGKLVPVLGSVLCWVTEFEIREGVSGCRGAGLLSRSPPVQE